MSVGYSGTPLPKKLGIKPGHRVGLAGAPAHVPGLLDPLPSGVRLERSLRGGPKDVILVFVRTPGELHRRFQAARGKLREDGGLWVCWPKKSSPLATSLRESDVREHGLATGLVDNKVCAVDEDWSGLRFVVRTRDRSGR